MKKLLPLFFTLVLPGAILLLNTACAQSLLSQGKTVTVSSTESASYPGSNAVDGSMSTKWSSSSANYNEWLYVDLTATKDIDYVQIYFADGRYALTFDIQGTNTPAVAASWVTMRTIPPGNALSNLTIGGLYGQYRYVRFNGRGRANSLGYRIAEFKVYGYDPSTSTQLSDINTVRTRLAAESPAPGSDLTVLITSMQSNGKWPDNAPAGQPATPGQMNYSGNSWTSHSLRLNWLACAYRDPHDVLYNDPRIPAKFQLGMRYFINQHFTSTNWYDTVIRSPQNLINGLMLMKGAIPIDSIFAYADFVKDYTSNASHQGANKAWVSSITIRKGMALDRYAVADKGFQSMGAALDLASWSLAEGPRADNSFHQHRYQINIGGYGVDYITYESRYMHDADGTAFSSQFTTTRRTNLQNVMLNGLQFFGYRKSLDFGIMGRAVTGAGLTANIDSSVLKTQKLNDPGNASAYQNWETNLGGGVFPVTGARHYWMSNMLVSHGPNFYMSVKIMSARNKGTETLNGQNLKGYNLPWGATNIMTSGNEYFDIFPTWNWSRIPGTTTEMSEAQASTAFGLDSGYVTTTNTFGGTLAVNEAGAIAFKLDNRRGITARKAYFFMENMMVCLGNSITATGTTNEIVTTVNQTKTNGTITAFYDGSQQTFTTDSISKNTLQWVQHDNVGYLFPAGGLLSLTNKSQSGTWKSLDNGGSATTQTNQVFNLYVRHSPTPVNRTYYYIVAPNKLASDMASLATNHGFVVDQNTVNLQAIRHTGTNQYAVIFYTAGQFTTPDGLFIKSDKPAVVQIKKYATTYRVSVCDPEYTGTPINITLNQNLTGPGAVYASGQTVITVDTYSGDERGKTRTNFFTINTGLMANANTNSLIQPLDDDKQLGDGIAIYPNPATSVIYVKGLKQATDIDVFNLAGRKFNTVHNTQVDISALTPGVTYFLRIHVNGKIISKQFIKQ